MSSPSAAPTRSPPRRSPTSSPRSDRPQLFWPGYDDPGMKSFLILILACQVSLADPQDDARKLLEKGNALLETGDYVGALQVYEDAHNRFPDGAGILINMGTALHNLGRNGEAVGRYYEYLNHPHSDPTRRQEIQKL